MSPPESPPTTDASALPPSAAILQMATGFILSQALIVIAELGIADLVSRAPQTAKELATATKTHEQALYRLLRFLASHGIFAEDHDQRFHLTPLASVLQSDAPDSVRVRLQAYANPMRWNTVGHLLAAITTGETAFDHLYGLSWFTYLAQSPEARARFQAGVANFSGPNDADIVGAYDFSAYQRVVDVGGGQGSFLAAVLRAYPTVRGVLYDQPEVVANPSELRVADVLDRCDVEGGNFFDAAPPGGDLYILKYVLHNWGDAEAIRILRRCCESMAPSGRVLAIEGVMQPGNQADPLKQLDLSMMLLTGGRERTQEEFATLYQQAGLQLIRIAPTPSRLAIIEGVRG